jgi:hypothetical protein
MNGSCPGGSHLCLRAVKRSPHLTSLFTGVAAIGTGAFVWFALPHERHVSSLPMLLFKLLPFLLALVAVGYLEPDLARRLRLALWGLPLAFLVFFCYFVPKILGFANAGDFQNAYYHMLTLVPFIILMLSAAYRLGGAPTGRVLRLGIALLLLQLSGIEDLAFILLHDIRPIPAVWSWASHMTVFLGHPPSRLEAYIFITVHVLLAIAVLVVPAGRVRTVAGVVRRRAGVSQSVR